MRILGIITIVVWIITALSLVTLGTSASAGWIVVATLLTLVSLARWISNRIGKRISVVAGVCLVIGIGIVSVLVAVLAVAPSIDTANAQPCVITPTQYDTLQTFDTYAVVVQKIGCEGVLANKATVAGISVANYQWAGMNNDFVQVTFESGGLYMKIDKGL